MSKRPQTRTAQQPSEGQDAADRLPPQLRATLTLDLEVDQRTGKLRAAAAWRPDTGDRLLHKGDLTASAAGRLDALAQGATHLTGHNIEAFDLPHLEAMAPELELLKLPALDTLKLNPLAFPRHPYHSLVKHYRDAGLIRSNVNDPMLDCVLALTALANQLAELKESADQALLIGWHWLTCKETARKTEAYGLFFTEARGRAKPTKDQGEEAVRRFLTDRSCRAAARKAAQEAGEDPWATAYALAWISAANTGSAVPPWVSHNFPKTDELTTALRERDCGDRNCQWCRQHNDVRQELKNWFGHDDFRPEPAAADGTSLQMEIATRNMRGDHTLGIMPTGSGKSLCYQLPALSRHEKTGALTVVISPLQALMSDQIAGLENRGIASSVTVNGMLSPVERKDALDRIRSGQASMAILAPESLRNRSVRMALEQRRIGSYVLDEAHCLSKWGHDFRPDYRYIARFIRRLNPRGNTPPVLCLTATAKPSVKEEIESYFRTSLNLEMKTADGGSRRTNLSFQVVRTEPRQKSQLLTEIVRSHTEGGGGAVVYCSTRRRTEETAESLREQGLRATHFHAGLTGETKKQVQADFLAGETTVICATNAFGMGIDKPDIRVVAHADIPGSLENYLQEAGRAGRDQETAACVLLYTPEDIERQHQLQARNQISKRDISAFLKAAKKLEERTNRYTPHTAPRQHLVATAGEILEDDEEGEFNSADNTQNRSNTAVAWLEETGILARHENEVNVFPSCVTVPNIQEARRILADRTKEAHYAGQLGQLVSTIMNADPHRGITTDELSGHTGLRLPQLRKAINDLSSMGVIKDDAALTAHIHAGTATRSELRLQNAAKLEADLVNHLQETAPDQAGGSPGRQTLHLRRTAQHLKGQGNENALPVYITRMMRSLAATGSEGPEGKRSLTVRQHGQELMTVERNRTWTEVAHSASQRRKAAAAVLKHLTSRLSPPAARGNDLPVSTTTGALTEALHLEGALEPGSDPADMLQQALLWLHDQEIVRLNQGLNILRSAMTIELKDRRRQFTEADYEPLALHYQEQTFQVHIMAEYAERGLDSIAHALQLALDYFTMSKQQFTAQWMGSKASQLTRRTSPEDWQAIVDDLNNAAQKAVVTDDRQDTNALILAGPGSGKTRALVHRIAYLVKARREKPRSIIALAYNRHAAAQIKSRLRDLIGDQAREVIVLTCHALAMRLTGRSFEGTRARNENETTGELNQLLDDAAEMLEEGVQTGRDRTERPAARRVPLDPGGRIPGYDRTHLPAHLGPGRTETPGRNRKVEPPSRRR